MKLGEYNQTIAFNDAMKETLQRAGYYVKRMDDEEFNRMGHKGEALWNEARRARASEANLSEEAAEWQRVVNEVSRLLGTSLDLLTKYMVEDEEADAAKDSPLYQAAHNLLDRTCDLALGHPTKL